MTSYTQEVLKMSFTSEGTIEIDLAEFLDTTGE